MRGQQNRGRVSKRGTSWSVLGVLGAWAFVALIVLPSGVAAGPVTAAVLGPPYAGAGASSHSATSTGGCGHLRVPVPAFFNATTGAAGYAAATSSTSCTTLRDEGTAEVSLVIHIPLHLSGRVQIVVGGWVNSTASVSISPGHCHGNATSGTAWCYVSAATDLNANISLVDETNHTQWPKQTSPIRYWLGPESIVDDLVQCSAGTCTNSSSGSSGTYVNSTSFALPLGANGLVSNHTYELFLTFVISVEASSLAQFGSHITRASDSTSLNSATRGNGISVSSVTVR